MLKGKDILRNTNSRKTILNILMLSILFVSGTRAQETLTGIQYNPELNDAVDKHTLKSLKNTNDTISLPFIDDFSYDGMYPDNTKWEDNYVFINNTYAIDPITIDVATFDALNAGGKLYSRSKNRFGADTLTSKPINLQFNKKDSLLGSLIRKKISDINFPLIQDSLFFEKEGTFYPVDTLNYYYKERDQLYTYHDTVYQTYNEPLYYYHATDSIHYRFPYQGSDFTPADSIYFSFFYQPQGLGDAPESSDSLFVEFYNPVLNTWDIVYGINGTGSHEFKPVLLPVTNNDYLKNGFRFRFRNIVSITGNDDVLGLRANVDHWNIDYVMLDTGRNKHDTAFKDVAFITPAPNVLEDLTAMPWKHYVKIQASNSPWKNTIQTRYKNLYDQNLPGNDSVYAYRRFMIKNYQYNKSFNKDDGGFLNMGPLEAKTFNVKLYARPNDSIFHGIFDDDSAEFEMIHYLTIDNSFNINKKNDTVTYLQKFHNYYAYDDGSAEAGYGLVGTKYGKVAYQFNSYKKDSLKAIYFYFNQDYDDTANKINFKLTIWDDNNGVPGETLYSRYSEYPNTDDYYKPVFKGLNHYYPLYLQEPVAVSGTFYVGWEQFYEIFLNVGFDKNTDASNHLYYNTQGIWASSGKSGALMIRPVFGELPPKTNIENQYQPSDDHVKLFPNPANREINIKLSPGIEKSGMNILIYDIQGRLIKTFEYNNRINIFDIPGGIYIVEFNNGPGFTERKKLIIDRTY